MNENIFFQLSKQKHNPDVLLKKDDFEKKRQENIFKKNSIVYNSITNKIPTDVKNQKDLELQKDLPINNLESIIAEKFRERSEQDNQLKQTKQKVILNDEVAEKTLNCVDLKNIQKYHAESRKKEIENNKNKYENIMLDLKDLGIIKN
jgi:phosphoribosyl-dephospho-CoA transferase